MHYPLKQGLRHFFYIRSYTWNKTVRVHNPLEQGLKYHYGWSDKQSHVVESHILLEKRLKGKKHYHKKISLTPAIIEICSKIW